MCWGQLEPRHACISIVITFSISMQTFSMYHYDFALFYNQIRVTVLCFMWPSLSGPQVKLLSNPCTTDLFATLECLQCHSIYMSDTNKFKLTSVIRNKNLEYPYFNTLCTFSPNSILFRDLQNTSLILLTQYF